jgi:hypothetical protein
LAHHTLQGCCASVLTALDHFCKAAAVHLRSAAAGQSGLLRPRSPPARLCLMLSIHRKLPERISPASMRREANCKRFYHAPSSPSSPPSSCTQPHFSTSCATKGLRPRWRLRNEQVSGKATVCHRACCLSVKESFSILYTIQRHRNAAVSRKQARTGQKVQRPILEP